MFYIFEAMSFKFIIAYIKHKLTANNRHGTHSPFVYKLADEVIYDFSSKKVYKEIEDSLIKLSNDDKGFLNTDFKERSVLLNNIFKKSPIAQLVFRLAKYHLPKNVMVIGKNLGLTTAYLAKACPSKNIIVIEEPEVIADVTNLDFVYLNGSYTNETILNYFNWCLPKLNEHSIFIIEGIYQNEGIKAAWAEIKNHPQVTVTIDLFWLGLVYFKKGQAKEHFKLKF